jgi:hypothetical protein
LGKYCTSGVGHGDRNSYRLAVFAVGKIEFDVVTVGPYPYPSRLSTHNLAGARMRDIDCDRLGDAFIVDADVDEIAGLRSDIDTAQLDSEETFTSSCSAAATGQQNE